MKLWDRLQKILKSQLIQLKKDYTKNISQNGALISNIGTVAQDTDRGSFLVSCAYYQYTGTNVLVILYQDTKNTSRNAVFKNNSIL